jgi:hypothetical protein
MTGTPHRLGWQFVGTIQNGHVPAPGAADMLLR